MVEARSLGDRLITSVVYGGLLLVAILSRNTRPLVTDAIVGFAGSYAVASHLIVPASAMLADRLFFFPSFWLMTLFALWVHPRSLQNGVARRIKIKKILAGAYASWIVVQGCITTVAAATLWRNDRSLFAQALQSYPHVSRTRVNYALALRKQGQRAGINHHRQLARRLQQAIEQQIRFSGHRQAGAHQQGIRRIEPGQDVVSRRDRPVAVVAGNRQ